MTLRDDFAADILDGFRDLAEPAVYRPRSGAAVATFALLEDRRLAAGSRARLETATLVVSQFDVPAPAIDDCFEVSGIVWQYRQNKDAPAEREDAWPFWRLACRRTDTLSLTGGRS